MAAKLGSRAETARELCYHLYTLCERKKRATEAMAYNGLVQSWPEIIGMRNRLMHAYFDITGHPLGYGTTGIAAPARATARTIG